ncbi:unnamed protein product, partial [Rotaria sordida]
MNNKEQTQILQKQVDTITDEEQWKNFEINFHGTASEFPGNKICGTINIEPDSARQLIKKFILLVNDHYRGEFDHSYKSISITGFDITKEENLIKIQIQAVPYNKKWTRKKISKPHSFVFTGEILTLSSIIHFDYIEETSNFNVTIKWYHIGDDYAEKYVVLLDNKEIQH